MERKICCIFGAGDYFGDERVPAGALVIAADGGVRQCEKMHIVPDMVIGDFDSLGYHPGGDNIVTLPKIKDDTDTLAAVKCAVQKGCNVFILFGCTGGRLSHTIANIQTLSYIAKRGAIGFLTDKEEIATVVCKGMDFDTQFEGYLSVFAAGSAVNVSESGLKYETDRQELTFDFPLGVSNEFLGKKAQIDIQDGYALIIFQKQKRSILPWI